ncbi:MAG: hypothetical protein KGL39_45875 [Patescibacteria group bacterium]|nr:hypothetical protein [Patescibacteria group bacterium]
MSFFSDHGTKVLGAMSAMTGAAQMGLATLDGTAITHSQFLITEFFLGVLAAGLGGGTIIRGFSNSKQTESK